MGGTYSRGRRKQLEPRRNFNTINLLHEGRRGKPFLHSEGERVRLENNGLALHKMRGALVWEHGKEVQSWTSPAVRFQEQQDRHLQQGVPYNLRFRAFYQPVDRLADPQPRHADDLLAAEERVVPNFLRPDRGDLFLSVWYFKFYFIYLGMDVYNKLLLELSLFL
jgi:hypothetical protein